MKNDKTIFGIMGRLVSAVTRNQSKIDDLELKEAVKDAEVLLEDQTIGSGPGEERRDIEASVTRISMNGGGIKLTLKQGTTPSLVVSCANGKHLRKVLTAVSGNALSISVEPTVLVLGDIHNYADVSFGASGMQGGISQVAQTITNHGSVHFGDGPSRKGRVSIQGSHNVVQTFHGGIKGTVIAGDMIVNGEGSDSTISIGSTGVLADVTVELPNIQEIDIRGSASVEYRAFSQDEIAIDVSGSGNILLSGVVATLDVGVSGSGSVDATALTSKVAKLKVSGSGDVHANVLEAVKARISGSGRVKISGNPPVRDTNVSGSGKIKFA
jgi:hypothetical protein